MLYNSQYWFFIFCLRSLEQDVLAGGFWSCSLPTSNFPSFWLFVTTTPRSSKGKTNCLHCTTCLGPVGIYRGIDQKDGNISDASVGWKTVLHARVNNLWAAGHMWLPKELPQSSPIQFYFKKNFPAHPTNVALAFGAPAKNKTKQECLAGYCSLLFFSGWKGTSEIEQKNPKTFISFSILHGLIKITQIFC